ncbi:MAG: tRNA dihydrouridine synthase DusB [Chromatiales bacterium]|nr:tRNA dihydrouridine synthase DusB [Chromatiales bacterium]
MAGVTDRPFRQLCRRLGVGLAVSEMVSANPLLAETRKSRLRRDHRGEPGPIAVQIAGADPRLMADCARENVDYGAEIIDINMGCPAKKVCRVAAGSALMSDEQRVAEILDAVVHAVDVPVTLKIRSGPDPSRRNAVAIARIAESAGVRAIAVHGRTRACAFGGAAEYATIAAVKQAVAIPVIANGDIDSLQTARRVLHETGADAIMIGRAAQGQPWLPGAIARALETGASAAEPQPAEIGAWLCEHLLALYDFYGEAQGVRIARKHIGWYLAGRPDGRATRAAINELETANAQYAAVRACFPPTCGAEGADDRGVINSQNGYRSGGFRAQAFGTAA